MARPRNRLEFSMPTFNGDGMAEMSGGKEVEETADRYGGGGTRGDGPKMDVWSLREREKNNPASYGTLSHL